MKVDPLIRFYRSRQIVVPFLVVFVGLLAHRAQSDDRSQNETAKTAAEARTVPAHEPQYSEEGELKLPDDFQTWVFVGSNLGLEYREDAAKDAPADKNADQQLKAANFHNVYINPEAYAQFVKTGKFPEKTILVLDIYKSEEGEPRNIVSQGLFPGKQQEIAVAVKNSARPDGSKTDWAYYDFPLGKKTAKAFPDKACYDCHLQHADIDNVWVQFYPTLRTKKASHGR